MIPPVEVDPRPCKLQGNCRCPPPPTSPHSPHSNNITSFTSGHSTSPTLSGTNIRLFYRNGKERPAIGCYLPRSCLSPQTNPPCFAQISRVSISFITYVLRDNQLTTSSGAHIVQRASFNRRQPTWRERLPLGTAEGPPGAPVSRYSCAHCRTLARLGRGPSSTTNERRLSPFFLTRKLIYKEGAYSTPISCTCTDFFSNNFLGKIYVSRKFLRLILSAEKNYQV